MTLATATVRITPAMMAEAFWDMDANLQAEFFDELARVIREDHKTNRLAYSYGELQWHHLGYELLDRTTRNAQARNMLMAMAAPLYLNTLRVAEGMEARSS